MLKDLKKILFMEIKKDVEEYEKAEMRLKQIKERIEEIDWKFSYKNENRIISPRVQMSLMKNYSFLEKWFFKRKEYRSALKSEKELQEKYKNELNEYNKKVENYENEKAKLSEEKKQLEDLCNEKRKSREKFETIKSANTIKELEINFDQAVELLKSNGIEVILDESDKVIIKNESEFDKLEDFIYVHKTKYTPKNDIVGSQAYLKSKQVNTLYFGEEEFSFDFLKGRNTIHFCQNGEVSSHPSGDFDKRKYAVMIPVSKINDTPAAFNSEDTFFNDKVETNGGYILCPQAEVENIQKLNPNTKVIGYEGETVDGYANSFLSMLGYKYEDIGEHSWMSSEDSKKRCEFMSKHSELKNVTHYYSKENSRDKLIENYNEIIGFVKSLKKYKENGKEFNVDNLTYELFNSKNKIKVQSGLDEVILEDSLYRITPSIIELLNDNNVNIYLENFLEENYTNEPKDNIKFLLSKLKRDFNIDISSETLDLLKHNGYNDVKYGNNPEIEKFYNSIKDNDTRNFIINMFKNKIIESTHEAIDALFIRDIISETYKEKEIIDEKQEIEEK